MNFEELKSRVAAVFPLPFDECLCQESIDGIIQEAIDQAKTKYEKIVSETVTGSTVLPQAASIVKVVPQYLAGNFSVLDMVTGQGRLRQTKINYYFEPTSKLLRIYTMQSCYVEYVVDPKFITIEDLSEQFLSWAVRYANALIKLKEGFLGSSVVISGLPIEFNYAELKDTGSQEKELLDTELEEMYFGLFAGKS